MLSRLLRILLMGLIVFGLGSCTSSEWKYVIDAPSMHTAAGVLFDGNEGFFYGHYISEDDLLADVGPSMWERFEAVIFRTNLEESKEWVKVYSGRGEIVKIKKISEDGLFLALGREFLEKDNERAYFLISKDFGTTWVELSKPTPLFIGFDLDDELNGYAWSKDKIYRTLDGGQSWFVVRDSIILQRDLAEPIVDHDGILWCYSLTEGLVVAMTPTNGQNTETPIEDFRVDDLFVADDGTLWLVGRAGKEWKEKVLLLKKTKELRGGFSLVAELPYFLPKRFYAGPNVISIFGTDMSVRPPKRMLMRSVDQGKTWKRETPKDAYANGPVYFENENTIWNVATKDRIQRRTQ